MIELVAMSCLDLNPLVTIKALPGVPYCPGHGRHPHSPVYLFLHVRGVTAAIVGQEQTPVVQPVGIDLDVAAVHDEDEHSQGLPGHLWGQAHIRISMRVTHGLAVYSCPVGGRRLQVADTGPCITVAGGVLQLVRWVGHLVEASSGT